MTDALPLPTDRQMGEIMRRHLSGEPVVWPGSETKMAAAPVRNDDQVEEETQGDG